jgi:hypothetical protein
MEASAPSPRARRDRRRKWLLIASVGALALVAARAAMPGALRWYVDSRLDALPGHRGEVGEIDVHLWRSAYEIKGLLIERVAEDGSATPAVAASQVEISLEWPALLRGALVGEIVVDRPVVNVVLAEAQQPAEQPSPQDWRKRLEQLSPFTVNKVEIRKGVVRVQDPARGLDVAAFDIDALATNLTNRTPRPESRPDQPAVIKVAAQTVGGGALGLDATVSPFAETPTFALKMSWEHVELRSLNDLIRAYGKFDVERGRLNLYVEASARDGRIDGYVKPLFSDLDVVDLDRDAKEGNALQTFWELLIGSTGKLLENQRERQQGAEIPISGPIASPEADVWSTVGSVMRNAFVRALFPGFDRRKAVRTCSDRFGCGCLLAGR